MDRESWLRLVERRGSGEVLCKVAVSPGVRALYGRDLARIAARYPHVAAGNLDRDWQGFDRRHRAGQTLRDSWGCTWENVHDGIVGQVTGHPLADWTALKDYVPPRAAEVRHLGPIDWEHERHRIARQRAEGLLVQGSVDHGFFFQRLYYLRGFMNLMTDIGLGDPRLDSLCEMVLEFNRGIVERYLDMGVDVVVFGDDLGMQERLTISPAAWRRYVKPAYAELFGMCRRAGAHVYFHSDGYIVDIMPDLIECGVSILNPQDLCNGLENIRRELKGKVCIDLDIDRQSIIPRGTPDRIVDHIRHCVRVLGSSEGGLMLTCGLYEGTPLENIEAVFRGMEGCRMLYA